jgi:hypothetical protein
MPPDTAGKDARRYDGGIARMWPLNLPAQRFFLAKNLFGVEPDCSLK